MKKAAKLLQNKCVYYVKAVIIVKHTSNERFIYIIIWFRLSVCMYVCMSVCLYVCMYVRMLFPHSAKTNGPIFKIQTPIIRV